jgi:Dyp-type peroxidase family
LKFKGDKEKAKKWIGEFTHTYVTSALKQAEQAKQFRQDKEHGKLFANFFLTRAGYMYLGVSYEKLPNDDVFRQGMKDDNIRNQLGDPPVNQWGKGFQGDIHALVLIAGDRTVGRKTEEAKIKEQQELKRLSELPGLLKDKVETIRKQLEGIADIVQEDIGFVLRDLTSEGAGEPIEHFGFRDGVSQPLFIKRDVDEERRNSDFSKWDPRAPLSLVLFKDPLGKKEESYGSFLVYRKLEQNVKDWNKDVDALAKKLGIAPNLAGAYTMGRFQDGKPVILSKEPNPNPKGPEGNNFNYEEDSHGFKCPFHAHIRKINPRGDTASKDLLPTPVPLEEEKMHRIVRRGINYGEPDRSKEPASGSGLLFLCYQANLASQFNFMQQAWAGESNFIKRDVGTDPVIGVEKKDAQENPVKEEYSWPTKWGEGEQKKANFSHWVTMKGGEYFFAPSMSFLKSLAPAPTPRPHQEEIDASEYKIFELKEYDELDWAIGLNVDVSPPKKDEFAKFFEARNLPFKSYVRRPDKNVSQGDRSAYDENINTLNQYIDKLLTQI